MSVLSFFVVGTPAPQGSKRHVGHGVMVESSKALKPWRAAVADATAAEIRRQYSGGWSPVYRAEVELLFQFHRPKSHYRTGRNAHLLRDNAPDTVAVKPDIDKLQRAVFDALKEAGAVGDDCQIVRVTAAKVYAHAGQPAGVHIFLTDLESQQDPSTTNAEEPSRAR